MLVFSFINSYDSTENGGGGRAVVVQDEAHCHGRADPEVTVYFWMPGFASVT